MLLDVERYLRNSGLGFRSSGGEQLVGPCWICGKPDHLYISTRTGLWVCFSGKCGAKGNIYSAVMAIEKVDLSEARRMIAAAVMPSRASTAKELRERTRRKSKINSINVPLPDEFIPCAKQDGSIIVPRYLKRRGIREDEIRTYGLGFCREGRYRNRIVFPVRSPYGRSFVTRSEDESNPKRYLGGETSGRLLFGWDVMIINHEEPNKIVLVEGPFDAMAVHVAGFPVMALMGKEIHREQLEQLRLMRASFVLLLDDDASASVAQQAVKLISVRIGRIRSRKDPAESTTREIRNAVSGSLPIKEFKVHSLRDRLDSLEIL